MNKYIQDSIRNNLRSIIHKLTVPQQKTVSEVVRGLFTSGKPIMSHLAQDKTKTAKKQSEKYSYHLGRIELQNEINNFALRKAKPNVRKTTIIAYDLSDIAKESAKKMENISGIFDGSKRKVSSGFTLHGVGINNILTSLEVHDADKKTLNQVRREIVQETSKKLKNKGIWVFDRGNDHKAFFQDLRHNLNVEFICRLKRNRQVVIVKTGEIIKVENLPDGKHEVFLMNKYNTNVDLRSTFTLIIHKHLNNKDSIRLISSLKIDNYSSEQFVNMYLERWGVENIFKRVKTKFKLESIRVLKYQRFINLVSLIQFAVIVSTLTFNKVQQSTNSLINGVLMLYKKFLKLKSLTLNVDSFITFMKNSLEPLVFRQHCKQPTLFSYRQMKKLGII